jgi:hypothetical protein
MVPVSKLSYRNRNRPPTKGVEPPVSVDVPPVVAPGPEEGPPVVAPGPLVGSVVVPPVAPGPEVGVVVPPVAPGPDVGAVGAVANGSYYRYSVNPHVLSVQI